MLEGSTPVAGFRSEKLILDKTMFDLIKIELSSPLRFALSLSIIVGTGIVYYDLNHENYIGKTASMTRNVFSLWYRKAEKDTSKKEEYPANDNPSLFI